MPRGNFTFYDDLTLFLSGEEEDGWVCVDFYGHETVKHLIESLGVPHTEVAAILVNGKSVGFDCRLRDGDRVEVFSTIADWVMEPIEKLQPESDKLPRFILDGHLGKLTSYLRMLGFDAEYQNDFCDTVLAEISSKTKRVLLTRDRGLLKRGNVIYGYYVRAVDPREQVVEILRKFHLRDAATPFSRCVNCNGLLKPTSKAKVFDRLEPKTKLYYNEFKVCCECKQIYWKGSHFRKMERFVEGLLVPED